MISTKKYPREFSIHDFYNRKKYLDVLKKLEEMGKRWVSGDYPSKHPEYFSLSVTLHIYDNILWFRSYYEEDINIINITADAFLETTLDKLNNFYKSLYEKSK